MDSVTLLFIGLGLLLLFLPLPFVNSFIVSPNEPISYSALIVPIVGGVLLAIGIVAYHKSHLQVLMYRAFSDFDQTGLGLGLGETLMKTMNSVFGQSEGFTTNELRAISTLPV